MRSSTRDQLSMSMSRSSSIVPASAGRDSVCSTSVQYADAVCRPAS
ncbi:hypothetical protein [Streptomyces neyagawaensis]|nr:hypothetical protein [Streptomyces neyagawaensis]MCL6736002.1 hypothetical protein [Streptomyces neyagawaensis]MDE1686920.1 hypothetical protein [Streptomyces neyagawaensis]